MSSWHSGRLSQEQADIICGWLPDVQLRQDLSWNLTYTAVLEVSAGSGGYEKTRPPALGREDRVVCHDLTSVNLAGARRTRLPARRPRCAADRLCKLVAVKVVSS